MESNLGSSKLAFQSSSDRVEETSLIATVTMFQTFFQVKILSLKDPSIGSYCSLTELSTGSIGSVSILICILIILLSLFYCFIYFPFCSHRSSHISETSQILYKKAKWFSILNLRKIQNKSEKYFDSLKIISKKI